MLASELVEDIGEIIKRGGMWKNVEEYKPRCGINKIIVYGKRDLRDEDERPSVYLCEIIYYYNGKYRGRHGWDNIYFRWWMEMPYVREDMEGYYRGK